MDDSNVRDTVVHNNLYHTTHVGQIGVAPEVATNAALQFGEAMQNVASRAAAVASVEARDETEQRFTLLAWPRGRSKINLLGAQRACCCCAFRSLFVPHRQIGPWTTPEDVASYPHYSASGLVK